MGDPYEILGIGIDADEAEIRRRYLELVREFPPDRAPERFAAIRAAYDQVRDPVRLLESQIFSTSTRDTLDALISDVQARLRTTRMPLEALLALAEQP